MYTENMGLHKELDNNSWHLEEGTGIRLGITSKNITFINPNTSNMGIEVGGASKKWR